MTTSDSTPEDEPRRWFQLHLVTVVALIAGLTELIWLNVNPDVSPENNHIDFTWADVYFGWPTRCISYVGPHYGKRNVPVYGWEYCTGSWINLIVNIVAGLLILALTAFLCEVLLRYLASRESTNSVS